MARLFASPAHYVQGKGVFNEPEKYMESLGKKPLLLTGATAWHVAGQTLNAALTTAGFTVTKVDFNGESSDEESERVVSIGKSTGSDFIIGLGGGKALDTAKNIADKLDIPVAILPTIASTDAPTSALSVMYTPEGQFKNYAFYSKNPDLVLMDTEVIAKAPVRMLIAGIGDAMATNIEAQDVARGFNNSMLGGKQTLASLAIAQTCADNLFAHASAAVAAAEAKVVTPALETIVESNTLLSGLGFESAGLAAAHAIYNGMTVLTGEIESLMHGEKVAFGYLCELMLDNVPEVEFDKFLNFNRQFGLPTTFKDLKIENISYEKLLKVGQQATIPSETIHQMPFEVTASDVADAFVAVDRYAQTH